MNWQVFFNVLGIGASISGLSSGMSIPIALDYEWKHTKWLSLFAVSMIPVAATCFGLAA